MQPSEYSSGSPGPSATKVGGGPLRPCRAYAPAFLADASAMLTHCGPTTRTRPIITMPGGRSDLQAALGGLGLAHLAMETTREAFAGLAHRARDSFVVMTPFLNEQGLDWALGLFEGCGARGLTLVTRLTNGTTALIQSKHETLSIGRIKVMNYRIEHGQNSYETFHAKVILADRTSAYVGSANLLDYERSSLELGVLLEGPAVHPIAELVDAVVAVSRPIWPAGHGGGEINVGRASPEPGLAAVCP